MKYVALLRGINVGGKNKVDMKLLISAMEKAGFQEVSTYINSGNIFFSSEKTPRQLVEQLTNLIKDEFNLSIKVLLRNKDNIKKVASSIPSSWNNDKSMKCDVMFLWDKYNNEEVLNRLVIKQGIDTVSYAAGALIWKVNREHAAKSGMMKLVGTDVYAHMTIRNCNTVRKIRDRML